MAALSPLSTVNIVFHMYLMFSIVSSTPLPEIDVGIASRAARTPSLEVFDTKSNENY
jgi:hypothetical protein